MSTTYVYCMYIYILRVSRYNDKLNRIQNVYAENPRGQDDIINQFHTIVDRCRAVISRYLEEKENLVTVIGDLIHTRRKSITQYAPCVHYKCTYSHVGTKPRCLSRTRYCYAH